MKFYNKKLVFDYVVGNDINDFEIDELENNPEFMMEVIKYTKDKKMYNFCSDYVKNNYEFVKFMVETFKNDIEFVTSLTSSYLKNIDEEDIRYKELLILINNLKGDYDDLLTLKIKLEMMKKMELYRIQVTIDEESDLEVKQELGKGFIFIIDNYGSSEIIKNYFAQELLKEIFYNTNFTLEQLIHKQVKDFKIIENQGINKFLINYIYNYDQFLAAHVSKHIELLEQLKKEIIIIGKNWDKYIENINIRRILIFNQEVDKYIFDNNVSLRFSIQQLITHVVNKYNLKDIFDKYDYIKTLIEDNEINIDISNLNENEMNLVELQCLKYVSGLIEELFTEDVINQNQIEINNRKYNGHSKILKFNSNIK